MKLKAAAVLYAIGLALHTADHLRRGLDASTKHVFWAGNVSTLVGVIAVALILSNHRWAPAAAVAAGFPIAIGVAAVHFLPSWGVFSDSFVSNHLGWRSWAVVSVEIAGSLLVGIFGWEAFTRTAPSTASPPRAPASVR